MTEIYFDGSTYSPKKDHQRLLSQYERVLESMKDGEWHTLNWLSEKVSAPEASVSARLRDARKERFGGHKILRQRIPSGSGLFEYKLLLPTSTEIKCKNEPQYK